MWCAPTIGAAASAVGSLIMWATELQPFFMGILVSVIVGVALTLPDQLCSNLRGAELNRACRGCGSCGLLCADGRLCGDEFQRKQMERTNFPGIGHKYAADGQYRKNPRIWIPPTLAAAITGPIATCLFRLQMNGPAVSSGMGTCGLVGQIGVYTGWLEEIAAGSRSQITAFDWIGMILICFVLPAALSLVFGQILRKIGWIKEDDLKL